jgi:hypothetical protein
MHAAARTLPRALSRALAEEPQQQRRDVITQRGFARGRPRDSISTVDLGGRSRRNLSTREPALRIRARTMREKRTAVA